MTTQRKVQTVRQLAKFLANTNWEGEMPNELEWWKFINTQVSDSELEQVIRWVDKNDPLHTLLDVLYQEGMTAYTEMQQELIASY